MFTKSSFEIFAAPHINPK